MKRIYCRACDACGLMEVLNLGRQPPSNALLVSPLDKEDYYPLRLVSCRSCGLLQLDYDVPQSQLFNDSYPLYSGSVPGTVAKSKEYAEQMTKRFELRPSSLVVEIGGNDGTLLKQFQTQVLNIEMSRGPMLAARAAGIPSLNYKWDHDPLVPAHADLIIANNVMAHNADPQGFVEGIAKALAPGGTFTAEFPWAARMIQGVQFDTIYHEHYSYFSLRALLPLFAEHGLQIYDVEELPYLHGGSLRIYATKTGTRETTLRVGLILDEEKDMLRAEQLYKFREKAYSARADLEAFLDSKGPIFAYGAAAKGNTLLNWIGANYGVILQVGDSSPEKIGKFLPGSHILVVDETTMLMHKPEYVLILPWNWKESIVDKLHCIRGWGGQFVTAIPELKVF